MAIPPQLLEQLKMDSDYEDVVLATLNNRPSPIIPEPPDDFDWDEAYKLFLQCEPIGTMQSQVDYTMRKDHWDDYGFSIDNKLTNVKGVTNGVHNRAITVVIWR